MAGSYSRYVLHPSMRWLGPNVLHERSRLDLSVRRLAAKAGVHASTVYRVENGSEAYLSPVLAIADALGMSLGALLAERPGICYCNAPCARQCRTCREANDK